MIHQTVRIVTCISLCILLVGCVTSVDKALPYARLPEITVATEVSLVASPSHPTAYLPSDPIPAGERVRVIGADASAAWLLVLHDNTMGWIPSLYSRTHIGTLRTALVIEPLSSKCTRYLGATFKADEQWVSTIGGSTIVLGGIYRPQTGRRFEEASLTIEIKGNGTVVSSDYVHTPLTTSSALILFGFSIDNMQKGSQIRFALTNPSNELLSFQSAFFSNDCPGDMTRLPVGKPKALIEEGVSSYNEDAQSSTQSVLTQTATPTPVVIDMESGPLSSLRHDISLTICAGDAGCDVHLREHEQDTQVQVTRDPGFDGSVSWSPNGEQFVFASERSGIDQLYIYDMAAGRPIRQITDSPNGKAFPSWSPDAQWVVYQEFINEGWHLWKVNLETMERRRLTLAGMNKTPHWSPQGDRIVFSAARKDTNNDGVIDDNDSRHIFVMDSDGKNVRAITNDPEYYDWHPFWMPDGVHVVFSRHVKGETREDNGPGEIYMVNTATDELRAVTFTSADESSAVPSPTGSHFLITRHEEEDNYKLYLASWDGQLLGEPVFIADAYEASWRPRTDRE